MYRWLLHLYPTSFRNEYGAEMHAAFSRERRNAETAVAIAGLWWRAIVDTIVNATGAHRDILTQDVRYTARTLGRAPGFALTALLVVSLGIGATTAAFSLADFVLLRPLPFPSPDRLVRVWEQRPVLPRLELSPANYRDVKSMATSYEVFAAYRGLSVNLVGANQPLRLLGASVTSDLFAVLGIPPSRGRTFIGTDDAPGAPGTVVLSHGLWQREFGGDESIVGKPLRLDDQVYTVIGVMPRDFNFPTRAAQLWTAMRFAPVDFEDRNNNYVLGIARLREGVTRDAARTEMGLLANRLTQRYPQENEHTGVTVIALRDDVSRQSRLLLLALVGASACVLLIGCANLANLLLARAIVRRREIAVRIALGAGHERLLRQLVTENLVLVGSGGVFGVVLAALTVPVLSRLVPAALPIAGTPSIDLRVMFFALAVTIVTGVAFGIFPLVQQRRDRAGEGLREGPRAGGGPRERLRGALVVAEIGASVVLLVMCGLLLRALWTIQAVDPGFRTKHALAVRTSLPMPKYRATATRTDFYTRVLADIRALPGVSHAAYISFLPMSDMRGGVFPIGVDGVPDDGRAKPVALLRNVTSGFFDTLGIPLVRGRDVRESDARDRQSIAVVSRSFGEQFFPGQDPIGRRFSVAGTSREIVGIVGDITVRGLGRESEPQVYLPHQQSADGAYVWHAPKDLVIRTAGDPLALVPLVRAIVHKVDADQPVSDVQTLDALVEGDTTWRVVQLRVLGAFAVIAVALAGIGIHGLLSFAVSARTAEIGVRVALGAQRSDIASMILGRSLLLATVGILIGIALAYPAGRGVQSILAGVAPSDVPTFAVAAGLALVMALAGSLVPALRAARVDPVTAIRSAS